jgi:hypothetical protein
MSVYFGLTSVLIKRLPARLDSLILRLCLDSASENRFPYVTWSLQRPQPGLVVCLLFVPWAPTSVLFFSICWWVLVHCGPLLPLNAVPLTLLRSSYNTIGQIMKECRHSCMSQEYQSIACELAIIGVAHLSLPKIIITSLNIDVHIIGSRFPLDRNHPSSTPFEVVTCVIFIDALHKLTWNYPVSSIWNLCTHSTWIPKKECMKQSQNFILSVENWSLEITICEYERPE